MPVTETPIDFTSADGTLRLHAEVCGPTSAPLTILCLHGLTRNGKDFGTLVEHLSNHFRVITADQRGRGRSPWDPTAANYQLTVYVADMFKLLEHLDLTRVVLIGTSMGGLMAMLMAAMQPAKVQGIVLNDIGPEVPLSGLKRLHDSLRSSVQITTWHEAALQAERSNGLAFPDYGAADWDAFARRTYIEDAAGHPVAAYDPAVLSGLKSADLTVVPANLWPVWAQLAAIPTLAIRGELSDILSGETFATMAKLHPALQAVTIANRGHAPMLDEPAALGAIDAFLRALPP